MKRVLALILVLLAISPVVHSQSKSLSFKFYLYNNGTIEVDDLSIINASPGERTSEEGEYKVFLRNDNDIVLDERSFTPSFHVFTHGDVYSVNSTYKYFRFPYSEDMRKITFQHDYEEVKSIDITEHICEKDGKCPDYCFGRDVDPDCGCGNNVCEESLGENYNSCPTDCPSGREDGICDGVEDGKCDPDCEGKEDPDCERKSDIPGLELYLGVGVTALIAALIILSSLKFED